MAPPNVGAEGWVPLSGAHIATTLTAAYDYAAGEAEEVRWHKGACAPPLDLLDTGYWLLLPLLLLCLLLDRRKS